MKWLNAVVDKLIADNPEGEIVVSSGVSPSGTYHLGTLREVLTAEAIARELSRRGRAGRHIHVVDDLDVFRKVPADVPAEFEQYLGRPLCDVPAPDGSDRSYADFFLADLLEAAEPLRLEMEVMRAHEKYRSGFFTGAIEKTLHNIDTIRRILEEVSGRKLDEQWSPVQIMEDGYLKNRRFLSLDTDKKELTYEDKSGQPATIGYQQGDVKLNWRIDWPARWWRLGVKAEPFGRDHATKGGSYDTGAVIVREVFGVNPPLPLPYEFINRTGDTKKMSKSKGDTVTAAALLKMLPAEVVWFFMLRYGPDKTLYFDEGQTLMRLVDEFSELLVKPDKSAEEEQLLKLCLHGVEAPTISNIPFSHLVASYQAALRDPERTLAVIARTEHGPTVERQRGIIKRELIFIENWLNERAPEEVKFELRQELDPASFDDREVKFLNGLAEKVATAPADADGEWFHKAIYDFKDELGMAPKDMFATLYRALIDKDSGPRAGWFLSILPRDWLLNRLKLKQ